MIKTVTTTAGVNTIKFGSCCSMYYWVRNIGTNTLYAGTTADIAIDADDTAMLAAGEFTLLKTHDNTVYVLGEGKVEIHESDTPVCPFKVVKKGGDGDVKNKYISDGLIKTIVLHGIDTAANILISNMSDIIVSNEMTVECCCIYNGFGSTENKGRIFTSINNDVLIAMSMYNNTLEAAMSTDTYYGWASDGVTGITVEPNEFVTLAMTSNADGTKFYKNSVECGNYGDNVVSKSGSVIDKICVKYEENRSNRDLTGNVYMLRFYDRILSAAELYANTKADIQNFAR